MTIQRALILRADALRLPLPDKSVDLIVSSPPYFALRSYRDGDEHYAGQIGSEPTPQAFLEALWAVMAECWRVLKPTGSCFINLGDKRAGSGGHNNSGLKPGGTAAADMRSVRTAQGHPVRLQATRRNAPDRYNQAAFGRAKSKMLLPHRFAIGCEDGMADPEGKGWIMRSDIVWSKLNGLPESVTDRCRDSHEYLFHFTKDGRYFAAVDDVRSPCETADRKGERRSYPAGSASGSIGANGEHTVNSSAGLPLNPLGKVPGSVWPLASEPLIISDEVKAHYDLPDHFAAFPTELVRRVILGWSPSGVCVECGEGRRPVVAKTMHNAKPFAAVQQDSGRGWHGGDPDKRSLGTPAADRDATITGYACRCTPRTSHRGKRGDWKEGREVMEAHGSDDFHQPGNAVPRRPGGFGTKVPKSDGEWEYHLDGWTPPPTRPSVCLDVFGGTGTTAGVARALGRIGVSVDLSMDYSRLADWRVHRSGHFAKTIRRTNEENQGSLL